MDNLRSGPILAVLIHFLLRAPAKIGPHTNSVTFVLTAASWLAVRTMLQDLIGCWNQRKLKALLPRLADSTEKSSRMILRQRREGFCCRFLLFYGLVVGKYALICAMEIQKIQIVVHCFIYGTNVSESINHRKCCSKRHLKKYYLAQYWLVCVCVCVRACVRVCVFMNNKTTKE